MPVVAIFGRSGSGKTTLQKGLARLYGASPLESYTTRKRRDSEGKDSEYCFTDEAGFALMQTRGDFIWTGARAGQHYGTRKAALDSAMRHPRLYLPALTLNAVKILREYSQAEQKDVGFLFLQIDDEGELLCRMKRDRPEVPEKELYARLVEERAEAAEAATLDYLHVIDATQPVERVQAQALMYLTQRFRKVPLRR